MLLWKGFSGCIESDFDNTASNFLLNSQVLPLKTWKSFEKTIATENFP